MLAIHICAPNDANGNPQRLFAVLSGDEVIDVVDEGYLGEQALREAGHTCLVVNTRINVSAGEYRRWLELLEDR